MNSLPKPRLALWRAIIVAAVLGWSAASSHAQTAIQWNLTSNGNWTTGANWMGGNAPANSLTTNTASFDNATGVTVTIGASRSVAGLIFGSSAGAYTLSKATPGGRTLTLDSSGVVTSSSNIQMIGGGNLSLALGAAATFSVNGIGDLSITAPLANGGSLLTLGGTGSGSGTISSVISGTGGLTKTGTGTWSLSGTSTYRGATTISQGTIQLNANAPSAANGTLGNASSAVTLNNASTGANNTALLIGTSSVTISRQVNVANNGTGTTTLGSNLASGTGTFGGAITLNKSAFFNANGTSNITFGGAIGGVGSLVKTGVGTITLSNTGNNYSGSTNIGTSGGTNAGTLAIGASDILPNTTVNIYGGTLSLGTFNDTIGALNLGGGTSGSSASITGTGTLTLGGNLAYDATNNPNGATISSNLGLGASRNFTIGHSSAAAADLTISGLISGNTFGITKSGVGTLVLSNANTYTGATTISGGTLRVSNTTGSATGTGGITVNSGGTLAGIGSITGAIALNGSISPGGPAGSGPGILSTGNQTWAGGGHYLWDINNATGIAGTGWDKLSLTGSLAISATNLNPFIIDINSLTLLNAPGNAANFSGANNYSWVIASSTIAISAFTGDKFIVNATNFTTPYTGSFSLSVSGTDLLLNYTAIPEPAEWSMALSMALFTLTLMRRRLA